MNKYSLGFYDPFFDDDGLFFTKERGKNNFMRTDIKDIDDNYVLEIEMPGINKEYISLKLNDGYLTVSYKKLVNENEKKINYIHQERYFGSMSRSFYVGDNLNEEDINATYVDGILNITFPKKPEVKNIEKTITIK